MVAYKAAVEALAGCHCTVTLEMAQEARSKLGDSAEVGDNGIKCACDQSEYQHIPLRCFCVVAGTPGHRSVIWG